MNPPPADLPTPDPAGVFAAAHSLWESIFEAADRSEKTDLSETYNGLDELMREVMRVGTLFETWSCLHIAFEELDDVWPYFIADHFGAAWLSVADIHSLADFDEDDCLRVAWELCLPIKPTPGMILPVDERSKNPNPLSPFIELRIRTTKPSTGGIRSERLKEYDAPSGDEFVSPVYSLCGHLISGEIEHITDRASYEEIVALARKLIPGIRFPSAPILRRRHS